MAPPISDFHASRARWAWRNLSVHAARLAVEELRPLVLDAQKYLTPFESKGHSWTAFALARLVFGYVRATPGERAAIAPVLVALARLVGDILDETDPQGPGPRRDPPPQLPFRADIDG